MRDRGVKPSPKPPGGGRNRGVKPLPKPQKDIPTTTVIGKRMIRGQGAKPAPKTSYGPGNQMQSYDYGMEEGMRGIPPRKKMFSADIRGGVADRQKAKAVFRGNHPQRPVKPKGKMWSEGAFKEMDTKKQENERLAKRKKDSEYSDKDVRMGKGVAFDKRYKGGNMTGAYKTINKIKKGLGDHPKVADALRRANEQFNNEGERNG